MKAGEWLVLLGSLIQLAGIAWLTALLYRRYQSWNTSARSIWHWTIDTVQRVVGRPRGQTVAVEAAAVIAVAGSVTARGTKRIPLENLENTDAKLTELARRIEDLRVDTTEDRKKLEAQIREKSEKAATRHSDLAASVSALSEQVRSLALGDLTNEAWATVLIFLGLLVTGAGSLI